MTVRFILVVLASLAATGAQSHPHVWVTAKAELVYDGPKVRAVRHFWTFDEGYSAVSIQGLDTNGDGKVSSEELAELAKTNTTSLVDFGYFTQLKANGAKQKFGEPVNERMVYEGGRVTLSFELPLASAVGGRMVVLDVYDPTFFVDFRNADGEDAVRLAGASAGCKLKITRPKPLLEAGQTLEDSVFQSLAANRDVTDFSARAMAICPLNALAAAGASETDGRVWPARIALGLLAVALVSGFVVLAGYLLAGSAPPPPKSPHPFGMGLREAAPGPSSGLVAWILSVQSSFFNALRSTLASLRDGAGGTALLLGIGFAYGVFHAAGPGHGKAVIAAYIVSSERALVRGIAVSALAALIQALVAILLVAIVFLVVGGTAATMSRTVGQVEMAGFGLVAALGAWLVWRKAGSLAALVSNRKAASGGIEIDCGCGPVDPRRVDGSLSAMLTVAVGAGIRPCAGAIIVLTLSRAYGIFPLGIAATLAMAVGTAITTSGLAALSVYAKRLALRYASGRGRGTAIAGAAAELLAAAFVLVIGLALMAGLWDGLGGA